MKKNKNNMSLVFYIVFFCYGYIIATLQYAKNLALSYGVLCITLATMLLAYWKHKKKSGDDPKNEMEIPKEEIKTSTEDIDELYKEKI